VARTWIESVSERQRSGRRIVWGRAPHTRGRYSAAWARGERPVNSWPGRPAAVKELLEMDGEDLWRAKMPEPLRLGTRAGRR
jgi:hypothetical protein